MSDQIVQSRYCQLGEVVSVPLDADGQHIEDFISPHHTVEACVVVIDTKDDIRMLGWKTEVSAVLPNAKMTRQHVIEKYGTRIRTFSDFGSYECFMWVATHVLVKRVPQTSSVSVGGVVNDHVCPTCGNNRCSRSEKTCWRCGNAL